MPDTPSPKESRQGIAVEESIKVCLLGASGAGKTCFLAGLAVLSEPDRASIITVSHDNKDTANYLDSLQNTLRQGQWPPPNNATFVLDMTVFVDNHAIDLRIVDYPGEDFTKALRTLDTDEIDELYRFSQQAQIFLLLFSPHRDLLGADTDSATAALLTRQTAHIQAITQVWKERMASAPSEEHRLGPIELGLVITQCDRVPGLNSPKAAKNFFKARAPNLAKRLSGFAENADFFGISVLGKPPEGDRSHVSIETAPPPAELDPYGYEPLFRWIRSYRKRHYFRRWRPWLLAGGVSAVAVVAIVFAGWRTHIDTVRDVIRSDTPGIERIEMTSGTPLDPKTLQERQSLIRAVLQTLEESIDQAVLPDDFERLRKDVARLIGSDTDTFGAQVEALERKLSERARHIAFQSLSTDFKSTPRPSDFEDRALLFIERYQAGDEVKRVREMLFELSKEAVATARARLRSMPTRDSIDILAKSRQIIEFVNSYEKSEGFLEPGEAKRMRRAADLGRQFAERRNWIVTIKKSGGLTGKYRHVVLLGKGKLGDDELHVFDGSNGGYLVNRDNWSSNASAMISWQAGDPISVTFHAKGWVSGGWVAYQIDNSSLAIGSLVGKRNLSTRRDWEDYVTNPYVEFEVQGLSSGDWENVEAFLSPGTAW